MQKNGEFDLSFPFDLMCFSFTEIWDSGVWFKEF